MKQLNFKSITGVFLVATLLFFGACSKENIELEQEISEKNYGEFSKKVTVADDNNSVILQLWSDNESELDNLGAADFEIMPIFITETFDEAYERTYPKSENNPDNIVFDDMDKADQKYDKPSVYVMIVEKNLDDNVENIGLTILSNTEKGWSYPPALLSSADQRYRTATIRGYKSWWRAYYGVDIKADENAYWTERVAQWQQIKKGETHNVRSDCYQMRVWRKYKNSDAITVAFDD